MPDIIITPSTGKLEFVDLSAQVTRRHSFTLDANNGLNLDSPLSAAAISAPLNVINVTVDNTNNNYPFVLASGSVGTGTKTLMMDGAGGTYNPFTNTATIDITGNSATTTLASDSTNLGGVGAANYVTLTGTQTLTNKTITGTFTGNLTGTGSWATNAVTAINSTQLNGQAATYYQTALNGTGFIKASGTSISYDNSTYTPTSRTITAGSGISGGGDLSANRTIAVDGTVSRRSTATINNVTSSAWTTVCNVDGDNLSSAIRVSFNGTSNSVVVNVLADILVNHFQDIVVYAISGFYTKLTIRIITNNDTGYTIQVKHDGSTSTNLAVEIFTFNSETITFNPATLYSTTTFDHVCEYGISTSGNGGNNSDIRTAGIFYGAGTGLTGTAANLTAGTATNATQLNGQAASYYTNIPARLGYTPVNQAGDTITGNVVINGNFTVTGATTLFSASSVYISSSQLVVDDNIITLNAFSPFLRYTGIEMIDSGSATTSSILWDSQNDYFFLTGSGINGKIITGPDQQANLTSGKIPKATGTNILGDSIITDNGSSISIGGSITATNLSGTNTGDQTVGDATLTLAAGTGIGLSATPTFTANATTNKTITVTNNGVTSAIAGTGISVDTGTGAVTITNSSPNATHTGDVTGATSLTIAANAVTTAKILDANVTNAKLANSSVTIGSTAVSLGATVTTFAGLTSVTSTNFVGTLTGTATTASYANALNPANNYTVNSLTEGGYLAYPLREYVINFTAQSTASFYPIAIDSPPGTDGTWHHSFSIDEVNQGGAAAYNVHSMYGEVRGQGWTDQPYFHRVFHNFYDSAERSLLGVWRPTTSWYGVVVYVRGGKNYYVRTTSRSVNGYSSATNVGGTVTYAIKNAAGADVSGTSANIAEMLNLINNPSGFYHSDNAYIGTNQAIHLGTTSAPNLSIGGTAANATILQTARNIGGVSFNGSADINLPGVNTAGNQNTSGNAATATTASYANALNPANSYSAASVTTTGKLEAGGNVIAGGQFSGAGTGLTGTAAGLSIGGNAATATTAANVNNGTLTISTGTGIGIGTTTTFTANQSGNSTITLSNTGVTAITTNTGLSTNASATGAVTITNTGVTSNVAGTGISVSGATGAVTITNSGVTSAVAGLGVSVSGATGAVTISIGQAVGTGNTPTFAGLTSNGNINLASTNILQFGGINVLNTAGTSADIYANIRVLRNESTSNQDGMYINYNSTGTTAAHLRFYANATNERMRIDASNGNVGIGTTTPGQKLDVEGRIRTRGATGTGGFEISAATTGTAKWRIEWDSASDSLDFNWVG